MRVASSSRSRPPASGDSHGIQLQVRARIVRSQLGRRKGERPSLSEAALDNLNTHRSRKMREFTEARESWLEPIQLHAFHQGS